jgi:hypothetical protein
MSGGERYDYGEALNGLVQEQTKALGTMREALSVMGARLVELRDAFRELDGRVKALEERRPAWKTGKET